MPSKLVIALALSPAAALQLPGVGEVALKLPHRSSVLRDAISQFADYHLKMLEEPDYDTAYIWYSIAVALNIPDMIDRRDDTESEIEAKELARLQIEARELFEKYKFAPFNSEKVGGVNDS